MAAGLFFALAAPFVVGQAGTSEDRDASRSWLKRVRIGAYSLSNSDAEEIVKQANDSHVYGIEVDNDIPGRYETLLHPEEKLEAIRKVSEVAHEHGQKVFVYIAGLECISSDAQSAHTLSKDHPEWLQRDIKGKPALFDQKAAFWIKQGEEDAWVSPYAPTWRKLYMERVRQIAATGVDGIYVDIPYWMTHFPGWENTWASFDDSTVAAFKQQTGLDARKDLKLGDFEDPEFRKWVDFRIQSITGFLAEIRQNAVQVNPKISLIPEVYPGIEESAVRVGADVYQIYPVADAIAHEYEFGDAPDHTAAMRSPFDWMMYQVGIRSFRAFAGEKPTWILNYSWDGAKGVKPADAMQTMFWSELAAGANLWDASGHVMSGSNDLAQRSSIYKWVGQHQDIFAATRTPIGDIGVYFSDTTRNFYPKEFVDSYRGTLLLLLQTHQQFQIVTPRTLATFHGLSLVLPNVRIVSDTEAASLRQFVANGGHLIVTGQSDPRLDDIASATRLPADPAQRYLALAENNFASAEPATEAKFLALLTQGSEQAKSNEIHVDTTKDVVVYAMRMEGSTYLFLANFSGIKAGETLTPAVQQNISIDAPAALGTSIHVLPFLGKEFVVKAKSAGNQNAFVIPEMQRGAVAWFR